MLSQFRERRALDTPLFYLCAATILAALLLGGGTRSGFLSDTLLQFLCLPLLLASMWQISGLPAEAPVRKAGLLCALLLVIPLLQIVPLPPVIWTNLPGRGPQKEAFELVGQGVPWMPISATPGSTLLGLLSLVVPLSIFFGTSLLGFRDRRLLSLLVIAVGTVSAFVGLSQVAGGTAGGLRFFEFDNSSEAVGFFANRNHFAALLYCVLLLSFAWIAALALSGAEVPAGSHWLSSTAVLPLLAGLAIVLVLLAAEAMARSRAGIGLTMASLVGGFLIAFVGRRNSFGSLPAQIVAGSMALAIVFVAQLALYRIMARFGSDPLLDARIPLADTTFEAVRQFMPFGSGVGTFVPIYAMFEKPSDLRVDAFANRAHNDLLEMGLELGLFGILILAVFALWFGIRLVRVWRTPQGREIGFNDFLQRAASILVLLLIAHSLVDYPLRTGALMAMFAFACGLLVQPYRTKSDVPEAASPARRAKPAEPLERQREAPTFAKFPLDNATVGFGGQQPSALRSQPESAPNFRPSPVASTPERWGDGVEWPDAWRPADKGQTDK